MDEKNPFDFQTAEKEPKSGRRENRRRGNLLGEGKLFGNLALASGKSFFGGRRRRRFGIFRFPSGNWE